MSLPSFGDQAVKALLDAEARIVRLRADNERLTKALKGIGEAARMHDDDGILFLVQEALQSTGNGDGS